MQRRQTRTSFSGRSVGSAFLARGPGPWGGESAACDRGPRLGCPSGCRPTGSESRSLRKTWVSHGSCIKQYTQKEAAGINTFYTEFILKSLSQITTLICDSVSEVRTQMGKKDFCAPATSNNLQEEFKLRNLISLAEFKIVINSMVNGSVADRVYS